VHAEFFDQGAQELKHSLEVGPLNDRKSVVLPASQMAFVSYVSRPLMKSLQFFLPKFTELVSTHMKHNVEAWKVLIATAPAPGALVTIGEEYKLGSDSIEINDV
jgi:hypothetical protein